MIDRLGFTPAATGAITTSADVAIIVGRAAPQTAPVQTQSGNGAGSSTDYGSGGSRAQAYVPPPMPDPDRPTGPPPAFEANVLDARALERREGYARSSAQGGPVSLLQPAMPPSAQGTSATPAALAPASTGARSSDQPDPDADAGRETAVALRALG